VQQRSEPLHDGHVRVTFANDPYARPDPNADPDRNRDRDVHAYRNQYSDRHRDGHGNTYTDSHRDGYAHSDSDCDVDADGNRDPDRDTNADVGDRDDNASCPNANGDNAGHGHDEPWPHSDGVTNRNRDRYRAAERDSARHGDTDYLLAGRYFHRNHRCERADRDE
jgi:hypothetical protein